MSELTEYGRWRAEQSRVWLESLRSRIETMDRLNARMEELRESAMPAGVSYDRDAVAVSTCGDAMERAVCSYVDDMADLAPIEAELASDLADARDRLMAIGRGGLLLRMRFLEGRTWAEIGGALSMHPDTCRHMRDDALAAAYDAMPPEWRTMVPRAD